MAVNGKHRPRKAAFHRGLFTNAKTAIRMFVVFCSLEEAALEKQNYPEATVKSLQMHHAHAYAQ